MENNEPKKYTESDLVSFGSYLLSNERKDNIINHPEMTWTQKSHSLIQVSDADILNWKHQVNNIQNQ